MTPVAGPAIDNRDAAPAYRRPSSVARGASETMDPTPAPHSGSRRGPTLKIVLFAVVLVGLLGIPGFAHNLMRTLALHAAPVAAVA